MNRRGIALPLALFVLMLVGALAISALTAARLRMTAGFRQLAARRAFEAARGAVDLHIAAWDSAAAPATAGVASPLASAHGSPGVRTADSLVALGGGLYLVRSVGMALSGDGRVLARDGVGRLVREIPWGLAEDSAGEARLRSWMLRNSRDNVAMMSGVMLVTNGWMRWP